MKWSFWGEWCFFTKFWKFYTKSNIFNNILHKTFVFYCRHLLLNNELSMFVFVIVMDKSRFCTLRWTFRPSFGLLLKLGAPKNKIENILFAWNFHIILHNNLILNFWRKSCNSCVFLNHKAIPGTFPSWLKAALGKQGIYLLLSVGITRNLSQKHQQISPIFFILSQFSSVYMDISLVKPIFLWKHGLCTTMLKQTSVELSHVCCQ